MYRFIYKSKIHRATVTDAQLEYEGSITLDPLLIEAADLYENEMVWVLNLNNGERFETYVIAGRRGSGEVCLNGPAARLGFKGDRVIVISRVLLEDEKARAYTPKIVRVDAANKIVRG